MPPDVFISYGTNTRAQAEQLAEALNQWGIPARKDPGDAETSKSVQEQEQLAQAIGGARAVVFLVDSSRPEPGHQDMEWQLALENSWLDSNKKMIPVVFGPAEAPPFLRQWEPIRIQSPDDPAQWTVEIASALQSNKKRVGDIESLRQERVKRLDEIETMIAKLPRPDKAPPNGEQIF
jgi:hypothetical protein